MNAKFMSGEALYSLYFKKLVQNKTQKVFVKVKMVHILSVYALNELVIVMISELMILSWKTGEAALIFQLYRY